MKSHKSPNTNLLFHEDCISFKDFIENTDDLFTQVDTDGKFLYLSPSSVKYYGLKPEECIGLSAFDFIHPDDKEKTAIAFNNWLKDSSSSFSYTNRQIHKNGNFCYMLWTITAVKDNKNNIKWFNSIARDITVQKETELELIEAKDKLKLIVEQKTEQLNLATEVFKHSSEGVTITNSNNKILFTNEAFTHITGYSHEEVVGKNPNLLKSNRHDPSFYHSIWRSLKLNGTWEGEIWNRRKSGEVFPEWISIKTIPDSEGNIINYIAVFRDISDAKAKQKKIRHQAYHDALTGLPNRTLLMDRIRKAIKSFKKNGKWIALLFIDLDNFKNINDSLGYVIGDAVLQEVATRLKNFINERDTVSRLGGDEFVIMLRDIENKHDAAVMADKIINLFSNIFTVQSHQFIITPSIGIALYPDDGNSPISLVRNADTAMNKAKQEGRNRYHLFTPGLTESALRRISLENKLRKAANDNSFTVFYQPKVDLMSGKVVGMEALVRWIEPDGNIISPAQFIPLAEETGLIVPIGEQVLEAACLDTVELNKRFGTNLKVSVNLSLGQFKQKNLSKNIMDIVTMTEIKPNCLELEITESTVMDNIAQTQKILNKLNELGITFSIDDFGTGYSSLSHLKNLPMHTLKIDQSFVSGLPTNKSDAKIVRAIISLAKSFDLSTVAEGIETIEQLNFMKEIGCEIMQGYYFSPPVPIERFSAILESSS
ncbi:EAL domain-containing protein [Maridesulfovibrio sp.]|uniref:EAL domain-containing protein n=1 Tax=Maridesulfovibrio sp. TaxID=2795000 RepID=UPI0029CA9084|nr:EAL domain-containing protein [Maridesulfovibrio sp.]